MIGDGKLYDYHIGFKEQFSEIPEAIESVYTDFTASVEHYHNNNTLVVNNVYEVSITEKEVILKAVGEINIYLVRETISFICVLEVAKTE